MLELQDWELAPGRIVDGTWESQDMIGLSRAYLSSRKSRLHNDLEVHNEVITSGSKLSFAPAADKFRSCFVGSGRLNVKIGENPEFALSHGSSFTIPAGDSAWAQNRLCIEALLHVSTMTIYD
jgi:mannose-6-phosphate isomerase-like protein (cupin superfamily)